MPNDKKLRFYVLANAVKYKGKASLGSVIGKIIQENPELKNKTEEISKKISKIIKEINSLNVKEQENKLGEYGEIKKEPRKKIREIPDLKNVKSKITVRFAPNPNGPLSIGHCRVAIWNWFFAEKYQGNYILRFDDTDPKNKTPIKEAYRWIEEDLRWLGIKINKSVRQSSRLKVYYDYAEKLIKKNGAYICTCEPELWRKLIQKKTSCPCRNLTEKENTERWKNMFKGYKEGEAVYRVKTDINDKNPALRDWPGFRIIDKPKHPMEKAKVWPLLNFASAIDDHKFKVTHILRGIDLKISDERQKYIYKYFGWTYPETVYCGKFLVSGVKSTSEAAKLIVKGKLTGWDDPRLGTIKTLKRRGFLGEVICKFIKEAGINKNDLNVSIDKLAAFNKDVLDKKSRRYFFVENPIKVIIKKAPELNLELDLHPETKKGGRKFKTSDEFYIEKVKDGYYRLMDCLNFTKKGNSYVFDSISMTDFRNKKGKNLIHWLPVSHDLVKVKLLKENGETAKGLGENGLKNVKPEEIIQFVRTGFARLEKKSKEDMEFVFSHK